MEDKNSVSNLLQISSKHLDLNLSLDFSKKIISGFIDTTFHVLDSDISLVKFDARSLTVSGVQLVQGDSVSDLEFRLYQDESYTALGETLEVVLSQRYAVGDVVVLRVVYATSPDASAVQWLSPAQTMGKVHPYLFTQCQAIHARSLYPCQDAPQSKTTYNATLTVPSELTAIMSAFSKGSKVNENGTTEYYFEQPVCIPSYLVAIAVGALVSREIGPRTKIWSEVEQVDAGAWEFEPTEEFIKVGEELLGDYIWGQYDILLLPPSFPYGGMENPMLTFVTPTLLSGDRSNVDVVAHEIAHSWTGNLITNKTWEHFWLNEGFTVFVERKIKAKMYGEQSRQLDSFIGLKALRDSINHYGADHDFTKLIPDLTGVDPDDAFSSVPYEKGYNFLYHLETLVGGGEVFEPFLKSWIQSNKYQCVTSLQFKEFFQAQFPDAVVDWEAWFTTPGMPLIPNTFDDTLVKAYETLGNRWLNGETRFSETDIAEFSATQTSGFLNFLLDSEQSFSPETLDQMDSLYHFSLSQNKEILFRWCRLGLKNEYEKIVDPTIAFVIAQGRMKFTRVLYRELFKSNMGKEKAVEVFKANRLSYHPICSKMVSQDLGIN